ncbi:MAG: serine hydrolase domain-containing protein [Microthrixaceae bacterium]
MERAGSWRKALMFGTSALLLGGAVALVARADGGGSDQPGDLPSRTGPRALLTEQRALLDEAATYSRAHAGLSMVVRHRNRVVYESYGSDRGADAAHNLFSGTKSFSCAVAVAAAEDGLLELDELVAATLPEWRADPDLAAITIRGLLSLSSGLEAGDAVGPAFGGRGTPSYAQAVAEATMIEPGTTQFDYGAIPFQIFGEIMRRKLGATDSVPAYLQRRVFDPIGLRYADWNNGPGGDPQLAAGAFLTARDWALYGQLLVDGGAWSGEQVLDPILLEQCFQPSESNPIYGLTFWLPTNPGGRSDHGNRDRGAEELAKIKAPRDLYKAAGVGGQKLYIIPSLELVVARQADRFAPDARGFSDAEFLAPVLAALSSR